MKKILLVSNKIMLYRTYVYNYFYKLFLKNGYEFNVITNEFENFKDINFNYKILKFNTKLYIREIERIKPDFVILFLHIPDIVWAPIIIYCKKNKIPVIYWNHAIIRNKPRSLRNIIYRIQQNLCDAIILYSKDSKEQIKGKNLYKSFIANNTINFGCIPKDVYVKDYFLKKYNIKYKNIVLFVSRILPYKKLDILLDVFKNDNTAIVIVGPGLNENQKEIIESCPNYYYLGPIYDDYEINSIFNSCDIFCIPGANGLSINQALYWGKPVVTIKSRNHGPEITYIKNGINGFIVYDSHELKDKINYLLNNKEVYNKFSKNCTDIANSDCNINTMFNGFLESIKFCEKLKR